MELLRSALVVDGRLSIGSTNRSALLRDQPKYSSLVKMTQLSAVVIYGLAGEGGGSMQSSATRFWHLKHSVQDCRSNCAHKKQFCINLLRWMASLIIMLLQCSSNLLPRHTLATTLLASLYCKAIRTDARSLHLGKLPCGLLLPCQWFF